MLVLPERSLSDDDGPFYHIFGFQGTVSFFE
jgi:hypothetical protein